MAFRLSGNSKYREWGWKIFESIERHTKISSGGYSNIKNVNKVPVDYEDKTETFLLVSAAAACCSVSSLKHDRVRRSSICIYCSKTSQ